MSRPKCLRCGAGSDWIQGRVPDEPCDGSLAASAGSALRGLKEMLERTKHEARGMAGGKPQQSPQDARRVMAAADGLRALAELEQAVERIEREATPNVRISEEAGGKDAR